MKLLLPLVVCVLTMAVCRGQDVVLPVHDLLLERTQRDPYLEILRSDSLVGARRFAGETYLGAIAGEGEGNPFRDVGGRGHFTRDQLETVLGALGFQHGVSVRGGNLFVPEGSAEAGRLILDDLRKALPPRLSIEVRLTQTLRGNRQVRLERTIDAEPGRLHVISEVRRRNAIVDYEVEIAQAAMIADPVMAEARAGVMVAIRPQLSPSGEWGLLETIARCVDGDPSAQIDTGHQGLGPIDRLPAKISETGRVVLVRPGSRTVQNWSGQHGEFELTIVTQWRLPQPVRPGGHDFAAFSMRGELAGFRSIAVRRSDDEDNAWDPERDDPWADIEEFAGGDAQWLDQPDADQPDAQPYVATDRSMWAAGAAVMSWFESMTAGPELTIRCYDVAAGSDLAADGTPPAGANALGSTRLSQVNGTWSATAVRSDYTVIRDWNAEVAQSSRIPDPRCERVSSGLWINVRRLGDRVEVDGEVTRILDSGIKKLTMSSPIFAPEVRNVQVTGEGRNARAWKQDSPAMALLSDEVIVEHPTIVAAPFRFTRVVAAEQPAVYRTSATELLGQGREVLVVISRAQ